MKNTYGIHKGTIGIYSIFFQDSYYNVEGNGCFKNIGEAKNYCRFLHEQSDIKMKNKLKEKAMAIGFAIINYNLVKYPSLDLIKSFPNTRRAIQYCDANDIEFVCLDID